MFVVDFQKFMLVKISHYTVFIHNHLSATVIVARQGPPLHSFRKCICPFCPTPASLLLNTRWTLQPSVMCIIETEHNQVVPRSIATCTNIDAIASNSLQNSVRNRISENCTITTNSIISSGYLSNFANGTKVIDTCLPEIKLPVPKWQVKQFSEV